MQLSKRLQAVAQLLGTCNCLADVGTDHGYIPIYLIQEGKAQRALAMDINKGPLERAQQNIAAHCLQAKIETRLSDGMVKLLDGDADAIVIAGMGGALTIRILDMGKHALTSVKKMVLQPQSEIHLVRKYLYEEGYQIVDEDMVWEDGKYYPMMLVSKGEGPSLTEAENYYGPVLLQKAHPVLLDYLNKEEQSVKEILDVLRKQNSERVEKRIQEMEVQKALISQAKERFL